MDQNKKQKWVAAGMAFFGWFFLSQVCVAFDPEMIYWEEEYPQYEIIRENTTWTAAQNKLIEKTILITDGAILTVEKGATIKFKREIDQSASAIIVDNGKIVAEGTEKEPIKFTSDQDDSGYFFFFNESRGQESFFRYVTIEKAGGEYEVIWEDNAVPIGWWKDFFAPTALAVERISQGFSYPVHYYQGKVRFENCTFNNPNSQTEIRQEDFVLNEANHQNHFFQVINSNFIAFKDQWVLSSDMDCDFENLESEEIDEFCWSRTWLKNNWYGSSTGWKENHERQFWYYDLYERDKTEACITGCWPENKNIVGLLVNVEGFRSTRAIFDPVVIIPGITGSEIDPQTGQWVLDPILHSYDDLWESLKAAGFQEGLNLFAFPYQWRQKNEISATQLKTKIDEIKTLTGARKVDLVAHSMGGLVARYYLESDGTQEDGLAYAGDVDQLITLGTPHHGSPAAYLQWEAGEGMSFLANHHFKNEAKHNGYPNIFEYIRNKVLSVGQLLPDSNSYLSGVNGFAFGYPENEFLQKLNRSEKWTALLEKVRLLKIAGYQEEEDETITELKLVASSKPGLWADGMPENYYSNKSGLVYGAGDGTVPLFSARGPVGGEGRTMEAEHRLLPTEAQCVVGEALGAKQCVKKDAWKMPGWLYFNVFSPVDIQIVAPDGKRTGKDFATGEILNEIAGAFYSGFETENEFISAPVLADGEYQLLIQGIQEDEPNRNYSVEVNSLSDEEEKTLVFSGQAAPNSQKTESLVVEDGQLVAEEEITAQLVQAKFQQWWRERKISKKQWLLLEDDLNNLSRWERIKEAAEERAEKRGVFNKDFFIRQKEKGFSRQLNFVQKKLQKNRKIFPLAIWTELKDDLQKIEESKQ